VPVATIAYDCAMSDAKEPLRLVVIGDSTSFTGDRGPLLPSDPTIYPNVVRSLLEEAMERPCVVNVVSRPGTDSREAYRAVTKDRHLQFEVLAGADAVVVGISSFDHAPAGLPPVLEAIAPYLRPPALRRRVRKAMLDLYGVGTRLTGSRFARTPLPEFVRAYDGLLFQIRALTRGAAGVVLGPTSHRSAYYGPGHPNREAREEIQFDIARQHGFATVACWPLVEPAADRLNPDGVHWPSDVHAAIGTALAAPLIKQLKGERPSPPAPSWT
jgi:diglucosylglycerate octanoyltransferase